MYLEPQEIPGWGQVHGEVIEDAVTQAEMLLEMSGPFKAFDLWDELDRMVDQKTWRSAAALEMQIRLLRLVAKELAGNRITQIELEAI
jgi:hypothetical protein